MVVQFGGVKLSQHESLRADASVQLDRKCSAPQICGLTTGTLWHPVESVKAYFDGCIAEGGMLCDLDWAARLDMQHKPKSQIRDSNNETPSGRKQPALATGWSD